MKVILLGEPKSTSHIYKHTCRGKFPTVYMSEDGKNLKESYQWQAKSQWKGPLLLGPLMVDIRLCFGTRRKQDIDNYFKIVLDSLSGIAWEDDVQIQKLVVTKEYDKENPRVELFISELE